MPDHIHILIGLKPDIALSDLIRDVKSCSTNFINNNRLCRCKFYWQEGFGGFSYNHSQLDNVIKYINRQEEHHKQKSFKEEYIKLLDSFNISYNNKFIFD